MARAFTGPVPCTGPSGLTRFGGRACCPMAGAGHGGSDSQCARRRRRPLQESEPDAGDPRPEVAARPAAAGGGPAASAPRAGSGAPGGRDTGTWRSEDYEDWVSRGVGSSTVPHLDDMLLLAQERPKKDAFDYVLERCEGLHGETLEWRPGGTVAHARGSHLLLLHSHDEDNGHHWSSSSDDHAAARRDSAVRVSNSLP